MVRACLAALALGLACGVASAQAAGESSAAAKPLSSEDVIRILPGRWEYRPEDGWQSDSTLARTISCKGKAERIWFERDEKGLIYHSQHEAGGSKKNTSRVGVYRFPFPERPLIRIQYEGEERLDESGKPVAWELLMVDRDTFFWHRVGWPPGATTAAVRRCRDEGVS